MAKEVTFRGKTLEEMKNVGMEEFLKMIPSRERRTLQRGLPEQHKRLLAKIRKAKQGKTKKPVRTHCRDMIIVPEMLGLMIHIHNGKMYTQMEIQLEMLGHRLGEFAMTRTAVKHSAPGIGATRSSASASVK